MLGKDNNRNNERILYQTKSNIIFGCKGAIYGFILLIVLLFATGLIIKAIGKMQVYLISYVQLPLTRYATIAMFVLMLVVMIYIIWQILSWYSKEYIITESKIVVKSGVLISNKNYLPFSKIQDINVSQSIFGRLFNVGSISAYSAYDKNQILLENISNPSQVEETIFAKMSNYHTPLQRRDFLNPHYDDVITPEHAVNKQNYNYYRNESYPQNGTYEPYNEPVSQQVNEEPYEQYEPYEPSESYESYEPLESYESYESHKSYESYPDTSEEYEKEEPDNTSTREESSETVVKRHFNKFKR